jgi:hypothetical protein
VQRIHSWTRETAQRNMQLEIHSTEHLGVHSLLIDVFEERARSHHVNGQSVAGGRRAG